MKTSKVLFVSLLVVCFHSPAQAFSFFGFGKYPSKMDAKEACFEWIKKGEKVEYKAEVPLSKSEREELYQVAYREHRKKLAEIKDKQSEDWRKPIVEGSSIKWNPYDAQRKASETLLESKMNEINNRMKTITKEEWVRTCIREIDTKQYIGIDRRSKKYFKY